MTEPLFSADQISQDAQNRVSRSGVQNGIGGAIIVVGLWVAKFAGWTGTMPPEVVVASGFLLTTGGAYLMNRSRIKAK